MTEKPIEWSPGFGTARLKVHMHGAQLPDRNATLEDLAAAGFIPAPPVPSEQAPDVERIAEKVHENWVAAKHAAYVTSRKLDTTGEELMVPYAQLSEEAKEALESLADELEQEGSK